MAKSSKLVAAKRGKVLLVRRRSDGLWMFPGGRRRARETVKDCLKREIKEELPKLKLGRLSLWKEVTAKNKRSGRRMRRRHLHRQERQGTGSRSATRRRSTAPPGRNRGDFA